MPKNSKPLVLDLSEVGAGDVQLVGGKCASLGELFRALDHIAYCWRLMACEVVCASYLRDWIIMICTR
jgi:hypothetical protein